MAGIIEAGGVVYPTAQTRPLGDNTKFVATTQFVKSALGPKANLSSQVYDGVPTSPTPPIEDRSTRIATTAFVNSLMESVIPPPTTPQMVIEDNILSTSTQSSARIFGSVSPLGWPVTYDIEWVTAQRLQFNKLTGITENEVLSIIAPSVGTNTPVRFKVTATDGSRRSDPLEVTVTVSALVPGNPAGGGYYYGQIQVGTTIYALIVAPRAQGEVSGLQWKTSATDSPGTGSPNDGWSNTFYMNNGLHPIATWVRSLTIGGYGDWYIPAQAELSLLYFALKPTADANASNGVNGYNKWSLPFCPAYTSSIPAVTSVARFHRGGADSLADSLNYGYYSSTQSDAVYFNAQNFALLPGVASAGTMSTFSVPKNIAYFSARAIRRIPLGTITAPKPGESQTIGCPAGYTGTQAQARQCTWSSGANSWVCDAWNTTSSNCVPISMSFYGPALKLYGYLPYVGAANSMTPPDAATGRYGVAYYSANVSVNGYNAALEGQYWMRRITDENGQYAAPIETWAVGYSHRVTGLDPIFEGRTATLLKGLKPGGDGQTVTISGGTATFPFYANDDDNIKRNEYENMAIRIN